MKKIVPIVIIVVVAGTAGYFYAQYNQPKPAVPVQAPPPPKPVTRQVLETPPPTPLPALADSDSFTFDALKELLGKKAMEYFVPKKLIRNIVATIDNLPRRELSPKVMALKPVPGSFFTTGPEDNRTISPQNAIRYTPYVKIAETVDAKKLVELYLRLYPLFQQAYEELGYPNQNFNARLLTVLDHLLATPDIKEPIRLVQPKVFFLFADPDLESRSIGQRILMRIGSQNEAIVKGKLREIKQEVMLHMREQKVERAK